MSNLYNLTKTLHTLAQEKAKKHGLELKIESDYYFIKIQARGESKETQIKFVHKSRKQNGTGSDSP